ncbi:MAG: hypothetical protein H7244_06955 [Herminiimonas sp.]|nr:hypothetical protein [Herminiimonas sp.]
MLVSLPPDWPFELPATCGAGGVAQLQISKQAAVVPRIRWFMMLIALLVDAGGKKIERNRKRPALAGGARWTAEPAMEFEDYLSSGNQPSENAKGYQQQRGFGNGRRGL